MATNYAKASFTEIYDAHTETGQMTLLKFHTPQGYGHRNLLAGFFKQFKHYKYSGAKVVFIPAATLPADPLQVSYEAGEPTIDPRDIVNPILHKGYKGERLATDSFPNNYLVTDDINENGPGVAMDGGLDAIQAGSTTGTTSPAMTAFYYQGLTDPSFKKSHVQRGFSQSMYPLVRGVGANYQFLPSGVLPNPATPATGGAVFEQIEDAIGLDSGTAGTLKPPQFYGPNASGAFGAQALSDFEMFTNGFHRLGWLETTDLLRNPDIVAGSSHGVNDYQSVLPKVYMYMALLPPAYKTEMYFRIIITHYFEFKTFRGAIGIDSSNNESQGSDNSLLIPVIGTASSKVVSQSVEVENGEAKLTSVGVA